MPIYEYTCQACQKLEELIQGFNDPAPLFCSHCGEKDCLKKNVSSSAFHLKGSGWYKDLYTLKPKDTSKPEKEKKNKEPAKKENKKQG